MSVLRPDASCLLSLVVSLTASTFPNLQPHTSTEGEARTKSHSSNARGPCLVHAPWRR